MTKTNALPRPVGVALLSLLVLAALALPALGQAAPPAEGSDPVLTVAPQPAAVPTATVGDQGQWAELELRNESGEEATVEKVTLEGEDAGEFSFGGSGCGNLQPGQHCTAAVALKPSNVGAMKTTLVVYFAGGRPAQGFEVSGVSALPHFTINPGSHDFGLVPIHSEGARMTFQVENDGAAAAQLGSLDFSGGNANGYWLDWSDCPGRWMDPGETCSARVGFNPNDTGTFATQLRVSSGTENFAAALSGEGGRPVVEAFPNPADFGPLTVGATGPVQTIVVHNSGNVASGFFIAVIAGGDAGSFKLLDENCTGAPLLPGGSCSAHVRFAPQDAGPKLARFALFGEGEGGTMVALSGEGLAPLPTLTPAEYDFGFAATGTRSAPQSFVLRNEGEAALDLGAVALAGADLDQFALAGDDCSAATIAPGGECTVRVRFTPDGTGFKSARLRIGGGAGNLSANLSGSGIEAEADERVEGDRAAAGSPGKPRPHRRGRPGHFSHGDAVASAQRRHPRRAVRHARALHAGALRR